MTWFDQKRSIQTLWHSDYIYIFASQMMQKAGKSMLDNQDLIAVREIVSEEIGVQMSDFRHDVSIFKQEIKEDTARQIQVLHEDMKNEFKIVIENMAQIAKEIITPIKQQVFENHGPRITALEIAFKKKMA